MNEDLLKRISQLPPEKRQLLLAMLDPGRKEDSAGGEGVPLVAVKREGELPLSFAQERLWFLDQLVPGNPFYNIPSVLRISGALDTRAIEGTFTEIVRRHETLRTRIVSRDGTAVQVIGEAQQVAVPVRDISSLAGEEQVAAIERLVHEEAMRPFSLADDMPLRVSLLRCSETEHVMLVTMHHIASDGWSIGVMMREFAALYEGISGGRPAAEIALPELPVQYADFALWQRKWLAGEVLERQLQFWKKELEGVPSLLALPYDRPRPPMQGYRAGTCACDIERGLVDRLKALGRDHGATLFMTLLSAFSLLMHRYSGQRDLVIGSPVANRTRGEIENLIGSFINTLALRSVIKGDPAVIDYLQESRDRCIEAFTHQDIPFEKLVEELKPERHMDRQPLVQVVFALQNTPVPGVDLPGLRITTREADTATARFDLETHLWENDGGLHCLFIYNSDLFDRATISRMMRHFVNLLESMVENPSRRISELELLGGEERREMLGSWNETAFDYHRDDALDGLFKEKALQTPDATAFVAGDMHITCSELRERAMRLSGLLQHLTPGGPAPVGVCLKRSPLMVEAILAAMMAGGPYVPLGPELPDERLQVMIEASGAPVIITSDDQRQRLERIAGPGRQVICPAPGGDWSSMAGTPGTRDHGPGDLVYIIFTSGSTGVPKGVLVEHRGVVNLVESLQSTILLGPGDRVLMHTAFTFDISVTDFLWPLVAGSTFVLADPGRGGDTAYLCQVIAEEMVTLMNIVPSLLAALLEEIPRQGAGAFRSLRLFMSGGEALGNELAKKCLSLLPANLWNLYGPTETTICSGMIHCDRQNLPCTPGGSISIGRPVGNTTFYILDEDMNPVPPGVIGELHIGGVGVARGYLGSPDLTASKFLPDPFGSSRGGRLYRTGDRARFHPDGKVEFLGRSDHQVKLRGFRIETGEIEAALARHPSVREAVVVLREEIPGSPYLAAYMVSRGIEGTEAELRAHLGEHLPGYMVPAAFTWLPSFSHTTSGKVDRKALPAPERRGTAGVFASPSTPTEEIVAGIWREVLHLEKVGIDDGFFDAGGHSLSATQVISRLNMAFSLELPLRSLFEAPTVRLMGMRVEGAMQQRIGEVLPPVTPRGPVEKIPLSFAQERLWFLDQLVPDNPFYNIPSALRLTGSLDMQALERSFTEIARRHEALRTTYRSPGGEPVQVIGEALPVPMPLVDLSGLEQDRQNIEIVMLARRDGLRSFNLEEEIPLRLTLARCSPGEHVLLVTMHHIASDGWSLGVVIEELAALYRAFEADKPSPLPPLQVQYADFALWQRKWLAGDVLEGQLKYWKTQLHHAPPLLMLPTDRPRPSVQSFSAGICTSPLPGGLITQLKELSGREGCTLFMTLLSAFTVLMGRYSGQHDMVIGSPVANRTRKEIEKLIGFFVNTLALRADISGDPSFRELMARTRKVCLEAYTHQDIPFEKLVEELNPGRHMDRQPIVQVVFALQNMPMPALSLPGLTITSLEVDAATVRFDLEAHLWESEGELYCSFIYSSALFDGSTIARMMTHFITLLEGIAENPDTSISSLPLLSGEEQRLVLASWKGRKADFPEKRIIHELIELQAAQKPDAVALVFEEQHLTYDELDSRATMTAHYLQEQGMKPGSLAGIFMDHSPVAVEAMMGIMKAGAAYVPLDPEYPAHRIAYMIEDSGLQAILTMEKLRDRLGVILKPLKNSVPPLCVEEIFAGPRDGSAGEAAPGIHPENLAYVIYTSGSTGIPKGTALAHGGLCNLVSSLGRIFQVKDSTVFLQFASFNFDASVLEIFTTLAAGATLCMARSDDLLPGPALADLFNRHQVTHVLFPPPVAGVLEPEKFPALQCLILGGEASPPGLPAKWAREGRAVFNAYGPTESTVVATIMDCSAGEYREAAGGPPIGRPIDNLEVSILDSALEAVPTGVPGELHIGGMGLAMGYLGRGDLTADRFIPHPFLEGARLYRSGDRARWRDDGTIEFLGRVDDQVKIRGYRIEPGEIESLLSQHYAVAGAVVVARKREGHDRELVAYAVPDRTSSELREDLARWYGERIAHWQSLYDETMASVPPPADRAFNITGWNSSYTGEPIPAEEMREWVHETVSRILSRKPRRVLEIGCGTGLMMAQVAPSCDEYVGTDFSIASLRNVEAMKEEIPGLGHVAVHLRKADDFSGLPAGHFDMVILNSIVQYFPGMDYLMEVLRGALTMLSPGGCIFMGDLRNLGLMETFHASVALHRAASSLPADDLRRRMLQAMASEEELLLSPLLFPAMKKHMERIGRVEVMPKRGSAGNELTKFRYDAFIFTGEGVEEKAITWLDWHDDGLTGERLHDMASAVGRNDSLGISRVPNRRVATDQKALELIHEATRSRGQATHRGHTAGDIRGLSRESAEGFDPDTLTALGERLGLGARVSWESGYADGSFDMVFYSGDADALPMAPSPKGPLGSTWAMYGNDPLAPMVRGKLVPMLREHLSGHLPAYMVPAAFVILDSFPMAPGGKIDRGALPSPDRGIDDRYYQAPSSSAEETLADIWREVLGLEKVGVRDNFFELGGDSIISIQVVSRANARGLGLTARMLFEHQTIAELAGACGKGREKEAVKEAAAGPAPLIPIQQWFFETFRDDIDHFNQAVMLDVPGETDPVLLKEAARLVIARHDALRLRYNGEGASWSQEIAAEELHDIFTHLDLSAHEDPMGEIETRCAALQGSLDIRQGPLIRMAHFRTKERGRLCIAIHHLAVDGVSWRILLPDLADAYQQLRQGLKPSLSPVHTPFRAWALRLADLGGSEKMAREGLYWKERLSWPGVEPLPRDFSAPLEKNTVGSVEKVNVVLGKDETAALLRDVPPVYNTQVNDVLVTALGKALERWTGKSLFPVHLEGHGREEFFDGVDLSRTVGWFTSLFPVVIDMADAAGIGPALKKVKEILRAVPERGIGYGILRYLGADRALREFLEAHDRAEISFNYLGQVDTMAGKGLLRFADGPSAGPLQSPRQTRAHLVEINSLVVEGELAVEFQYSREFHRRETMERLAAGFLESLQAIILHCQEPGSGGYTPSDFPLAPLSQEAIDRIAAGRGAIEDIYPLSPMQRGMLFHTLYEPRSGVYHEIMSFQLRGSLEPLAFRRAWQAVVDRHAILRTSFINEGLEEPMQVVWRQVTLPWAEDDWSLLPPGELQEKKEKLLSVEGMGDLDLAQAPAVRCRLIHTGEERWLFAWHFHHILLDGWCLPLVLDEVLRLYESYTDGHEISLSRPRRYRDYIEWLGRQDLAGAEKFWRAELSGILAPTSLGLSRTAPAENGYRETIIPFSRDLTSRLTAFARKEHVTLYTLFQGAWALLLSRLSGEKEVIFGTVTSGRPADIPGVEDIMGLFINAIPVHAGCHGDEPAGDWLRALHARHVSREQYSYASLVQISSWSDIPGGDALFESIIGLENYPVQDSLKEDTWKLAFEDFRIVERTNYVINIGAMPGDELRLRVLYDAGRLDEGTIVRLMGHLETVFEGLIASADRPIGDISLLTERERREIMGEWNEPLESYGPQECIHRLVEAQADARPDAVALQYEEQALTYGELNGRANRLAHMLMEYGIGPDMPVGLIMDRSVEAVIAILAVLKAGGAYVPMDPDLPEERVLSILDDSGTSLVLSKDRLLTRFTYTYMKRIGWGGATPVITPARCQITDFDSLPHPDRGLVDYGRYHRFIGLAPARHGVSIQGTRGCPYNCAYCHKIWPKKHVVRDAANIFAEIQRCYNAGIRRFTFLDDIFNLDKKNSTRLFEMIIKSGIKVQLFFPNGVRGDILTEEGIDLMVEAGMVHIAMALETASPRLQKLVRKNLDLEKFRENIHYIAARYPDLLLELFMMIGFPSESEEEAQMTLEFLKEIHWVHFPYLHVLKIYPNTDMYRLALDHGVPQEAIERSLNLTYHELPETLPFPKSFARRYQVRFMNEYFLHKERLLSVLPRQLDLLTEDELVQKYDSYLPARIQSFDDLLRVTGISRDELGAFRPRGDDEMAAPDFVSLFERPSRTFNEGAMRVLFLDVSKLFTSERGESLYDMVEPPLGFMYLGTYLEERFGGRVKVKVAQSRIDFDNHDELRRLVEEFKPHLIGLRTLSCYREFFHRTLTLMRQWGIETPIIAGGPYATSDHVMLVHEPDIDLLVLGEGELTLGELVEAMLAKGMKLPGDEVLARIDGIAFVKREEKALLRRHTRRLLSLDHLAERLAGYPASNPSLAIEPGNLAYVIYTSGSTGKPKGVLIPHCHAVDLFEATKKLFDYRDDDTWSCFHSFAFDFSVWEIWGALFHGARLVLVPHCVTRDPGAFHQLLREEGVTILSQTPSAFMSLMDAEIEKGTPFTGLRYVVFGGEALDVARLAPWWQRHGEESPRLVNMYGITETTVHSTFQLLGPAGLDRDYVSSPIGTRLPDMTFYVLDREGAPVPTGVPGELHIGGGRLARCYLGNPVITAERFIPDPSGRGGRLYRTGDLVRRLPDGTLDYLGRVDHQVKIRGYRIELGEIESLLAAHPMVERTVVVKREDIPGQPYMAAYVQPVSPAVTGHEVHEYLKEKLPEYMVPTTFVMMAALPLTPGGKVDRRALPAPQRGGEASRYMAPSTPTEEIVAGIWKEVLSLEKAGIHDNFLEIGGHSLNATQVISRVSRVFPVELPLRTIFDFPTLRELSSRIDSALHSSKLQVMPPLLAEPRQGPLPLSFAQERLWFLDQLVPGNPFYNIPLAYRIGGRLDQEALEGAFREITRRHESLRTRFVSRGGEPAQVVEEHARFAPARVDLSHLALEAREAELERLVRQEALGTFDLAGDPLIRVTLIRCGDEEHVLLLTMHHIVSDGWSMGVMMKEAILLYEASLHDLPSPLPPLPVQYADFALWQRRWLSGRVLELQMAYWKEQLRDAPALLPLPYDRPRPPVQSFRGGVRSRTVVPGTLYRLRTLSDRSGATLFMTVLSAFAVLMSRYSGEEDLLIGSPVANRTQAEIENLIGFFVNTLVLRQDLSQNCTFRELLAATRKTCIDAYTHQDIPFEKIVDELRPERSMDRQPLVQVMFALQNAPAITASLSGLTVEHLAREAATTRFDLEAYLWEGPAGLDCTFMYSADLFDSSTIDRMLEHYEAILERIAGHLDERIHRLTIPTGEERLLMARWNETAVWYPRERSLPGLFGEVAHAFPDSVAVVQEEHHLTYGALNSQADAIAIAIRMGRKITHKDTFHTRSHLKITGNIPVAPGDIGIHTNSADIFPNTVNDKNIDLLKWDSGHVSPRPHPR